ncbi:hypothetical protein NGB36_07105 [Streptomyces sp. RB6PN25]|uniref:Chaplin domain-containing protein n=1 Tax=Streptomyces humicola TaxID=2953240 RepID=A0ABT1PRS3_9ACTN|nr:hypothetical protein [Streptomyces humicola]MCQ4080370.1 hypothetical protein [Streptomyces humicola]
MRTRAWIRTAAVGAVVAGAFATAAPAWADGLGDTASPSLAHGCVTRTAAGTVGATTAGGGAAVSNVLSTPLSGPLNHCGNADIPSNVIDTIPFLAANSVVKP